MKKLALTVCILLCSCAPQFTHQQATPDDLSPDIILVTIAGRCGFACSLSTNWDYFTASGATEQVKQALRQQGKKVWQISGTSSLNWSFTSPESKAQQYGYPWIKEQLGIAASRFPGAQVIIMGHSHGSVFAHQLVRDYSREVLALIDLDAQCLMWTDYRETPYAHNCDRLKSGHRASDITPDNVKYNLEIQSSGSDIQLVASGPVYSPVRDRAANIRPDGSRSGITTVITGDNHIMMPRGGSESMKRVTSFVTQLVRGGNAPGIPSKNASTVRRVGHTGGTLWESSAKPGHLRSRKKSSSPSSAGKSPSRSWLASMASLKV